MTRGRDFMGALFATVVLSAASLPVSLAASPSPSAAPSPTSSDDWTALDWSAPLPIPEGVGISDILPGGDGYVGFGTQVDNVTEAAVFTTADGHDWRTLYRAPGTEAGSAFIDAVKVGDGYVAAGSVGK